jgi:hypothetical protein
MGLYKEVTERHGSHAHRENVRPVNLLREDCPLPQAERPATG